MVEGLAIAEPSPIGIVKRLQLDQMPLEASLGHVSIHTASSMSPNR
jgi:hypothetical protein